ncbi:hypothetical protein AtEden1_Chr5g0115881 [Arabidopsis thaliana]
MDFGYTIKALRSKNKHYLKSLCIVSLLEDTKTKTHTDFRYTIKASRIKKKLGKCFGVEFDFMSCGGLSIRT